MTTRKGTGDLGNNVPFKKPKLQAAPPPEMWCDDSDDDDLILLASQAVEQNYVPNNFQSFMNNVEKDSKTSTQQEDTPPVAVNVALRAKVTSNLTVNQDKASQDFFRKKIETLEKDIQKTKGECTLAKERVQIKDYEVSSLKLEMKELQKANSELRLKLVKNEQFNKEIQKNKVMEKQLQKVETELELKRLELLKLKSDRRMSSQAHVDLNSTIAVNQQKAKEAAEETKTNAFNLNVLISSYGVTKKDSWQIRLAHRLFENVPSEGIGAGGIAMFMEQLSYLQRTMGLVMQGQPLDVQRFISVTAEAVKLAGNAIAMKYDSSAQLMNGKHRSRRNILSDHDLEHQRADGCIYDKDPLYPDEELIPFRRILAIFSLACKYSRELQTSFFTSPLVDSLLKLLQNLIRTTDDYQTRTSGIVQSASVLLLNLVELRGGNVDKIHNFFKALSFSRLNSFSLYILLKILTTLDVSAISSFICTGCDTKEYSINTAYNTVQFTSRSCLLQIITTTIECTFPLSPTANYTLTRYQHLLTMTKCLMQFFRRSILEINSDWLRVDHSCLCYIKLTTSCVILAHLCLHLFHTVPRLRTQMRRVQAVSQLALLLIHDIFTANLQMKLLYSLGRPIKNRLIVVYNLLMHYNESFYFRLAQVKALESFEVNLLANTFERPSGAATAVNSSGEEKGHRIWEDQVDV